MMWLPPVHPGILFKAQYKFTYWHMATLTTWYINNRAPPYIMQVVKHQPAPWSHGSPLQTPQPTGILHLLHILPHTISAVAWEHHVWSTKPSHGWTQVTCCRSCDHETGHSPSWHFDTLPDCRPPKSHDSGAGLPHPVTWYSWAQDFNTFT